MPTYEYRCNACKRELEIQQRMADPNIVRCDVCGADAMEKLISWTSVRGGGQDAALLSSNPREAMKATVTRNNIPPKQETPAPVAATPHDATGSSPTVPAVPTASAAPIVPAESTVAATSTDDDDDDDPATSG